MNLPALRTQLIKHEGLRLKPYRDTVGKLTIGVGRNLTDNGITAKEAMALLEDDIANAVADLRQHFAWFDSLDDVRQRVLADMCFNLGIWRLGAFARMLKAIQAGDYAVAAQEMLESRWAQQVGGRAHTLAAMMTTGRDEAEA